jgi:hypothetical protein
MSKNLTAEQVKEQHVQVLGNEFGLFYYSLYNEVIWMNFKWIEFKELYGKKVSRIELLNKSAPFLFFVIQKVLWENIILGIARITDNHKMYGKKNISIKAIPGFITDKAFKLKIESAINNVLTESSFCRDWRNRWIAHKDLSLSVEENAKPLEVANREKEDNSLEALFTLINLIENNFFKSTTMFKYLEPQSGAISLLYLIDDGLNARRELLERLKKGEINSTDMKNYEI